MRVLVYGLGRSGLAVARLLSRQGHQVLAFDGKPTEAMRHQLTDLGLTLIDAPSLDVDICIAAPGIAFDHPDLVALRQRGIETVGEVEWVYRTIEAPIIGITGTAGKGTVTRWTEGILQAAGHDAIAGGNINPALAEVAQAGKTLVAELSSFQLERCPSLKPKTAVILNLDIDHLDRHGTVAAYHAAKRNILSNLGTEELYIYLKDHPVLASWAGEIVARKATFSTSQEADAHIHQEQLILHQQVLMPVKDLPFSGNHHILNALAVSLICAAEGLSHTEIAQGLMNVETQRGRCEVIRQLGDITFIEDSIATRSLAVQAALEASPAPIVWIAGGVDKGADFTGLEPLIRHKVSLMIGIGEAASLYANQVSQWTKTHVSHCPDGEAALREACQLGIDHLNGCHEARGSILLAPLGASFDQFRDYQDRADTFRRIVMELRPLDLAQVESKSWISC